METSQRLEDHRRNDGGCNRTSLTVTHRSSISSSRLGQALLSLLALVLSRLTLLKARVTTETAAASSLLHCGVVVSSGATGDDHHRFSSSSLPCATSPAVSRVVPHPEASRRTLRVSAITDMRHVNPRQRCYISVSLSAVPVHDVRLELNCVLSS